MSSTATFKSRTRFCLGSIIAALQQLVAEPQGLTVAGAADIVILWVEPGRTLLADTRRTVELVR
jgi:hypothetical protein